MSNSRHIEYLSIEGNHIGDESCKELCEGISQSQHIKIINLSQNNITDIGA